VVSMLFATHPALKSIGFSTLIGMLSTILITYTLQPLFFRWMMKIPYLKKKLTK
jgi:cytochrome bd-type quinol oxidase subunit 2